MATWARCIRYVSSDETGTTIVFINLDNVLTIDSEGNITKVIMVGGEQVIVETTPEEIVAFK
jgi:DNA-binding LytR/AlgR family response regulator